MEFSSIGITFKITGLPPVTWISDSGRTATPVDFERYAVMEHEMLRGKTESETCRLNGWNVGTVLVGDEGYGPEKIKITAIGESSMLARRIENQRGEQVEDSEGTWTLSYREWKSA